MSDSPASLPASPATPAAPRTDHCGPASLTRASQQLRDLRAAAQPEQPQIRQTVTLDANVMEGPLSIHAGVSEANIDQAVASIDEEVDKLVTNGLTQKELDDSRRFLIFAMPRALETNAGIANYLQTAEFFGLGLDFDVRIPDLLNAVTLDEANALAKKFLSVDRATIVIAGPYDQ